MIKKNIKIIFLLLFKRLSSPDLVLSNLTSNRSNLSATTPSGKRPSVKQRSHKSQSKPSMRWKYRFFASTPKLSSSFKESSHAVHLISFITFSFNSCFCEQVEKLRFTSKNFGLAKNEKTVIEEND